MMLACLSGCFISVEQPGSSAMFMLEAFQRLLDLGCRITKFCFCSYGSGFQKPSKWLRNKHWYDALAGQCSCDYKGRHFTVQGTFTRASVHVFNQRCKPDAQTVYGRIPRAGEAVSSYSASYPLPLCQAMAAGSKAAFDAGVSNTCHGASAPSRPPAADLDDDLPVRKWFDDPAWVEDICESLEFRELLRLRFKKAGHINGLECRVYKSWLKHCCKKYPRSRLVAFLDSRVTMGAAAKGRSSSKALSRILRTSLPYIIGGCLYPGSLHCRSAWNRADGPSRDKEVPGPSRDVPKWLSDLQTGKVELFDQMVELSRWSRPVGNWIR